MSKREVYDNNGVLKAMVTLSKRNDLLPEEKEALDYLKETMLNLESMNRILLNEAENLQQLKNLSRVEVTCRPEELMANFGESTMKLINQQKVTDEEFKQKEKRRYGTVFNLKDYLNSKDE